jgi:hypothetical protein
VDFSSSKTFPAIFGSSFFSKTTLSSTDFFTDAFLLSFAFNSAAKLLGTFWRTRGALGSDDVEFEFDLDLEFRGKVSSIVKYFLSHLVARK